MSELPPKVAIIGGGYAGLAAAVTLAAQRVPVTLYEAAATLGGRARRVDINGVALDNGLHILIGAYRETLRLVAQVNPHPEQVMQRLPLDWHIHQRLHLQAPRLPAPLHLLGALLLAKGVSMRERFSALRMMHALRRAKFQLGADTTVSALLASHRQGHALSHYLWGPLCVAALNTPPETASAQLFLNVLRDGLNADRAGSDLIIARTDLTALFPQPAATYVGDRGGTVLTSTRVTSLRADVAGFVLDADGTQKAFSHVICALPPHQVCAFLQNFDALADARKMIASLSYQPITSVYLQFDGAVHLPSPMLGLADGPAHWLFDREALCGQRGLIGAVISAEGSHQNLTQDALAAQLHETLIAKFGALPALQWQRVITEKRATFSAVPGLQRPLQRTPHKNLWLAGDYTASDYPATLEAAVRSGIACAQGILSHAAAL